MEKMFPCSLEKTTIDEAKMSELGQFCHVLCAQNTMEKLVPLSLEKTNRWLNSTQG
jgi:hypothetical protein